MIDVETQIMINEFKHFETITDEKVIINKIEEIRKESKHCITYKISQTLNYVKFTFIRFIFMLNLLINISDEEIELRVNTEYLTEDDYKEINFTYAQFSFSYKTQILYTGLLTLYTNYRTSIAELYQEHGRSKKYENKLDKIKSFNDMLFIDDFVQLVWNFRTKLKIIQKNYALVDNFLIQSLLQKLKIDSFYIETTDKKYIKGFEGEVLRGEHTFKIKERNIKLKIKRNKMIFSISKMKINKNIEFQNLNIEVGRNYIDVNGEKIKRKHLLYFHNKHYKKCIVLNLNLRRVLLGFLNIKSFFKKHNLKNKLLINGKYKTRIKLNEEKSNVNNFFNHRYFKNLSMTIIYLIERRYHYLPNNITNFSLTTK
jgi:hypothetical protein